MAGNGTRAKGRIMSPWPPPTISPRRVHRRRRAIAVAIGVTAVLLVGVPLGVYGHYETTHDIPNPFWGTFTREFTYTPEQGPPGGGLIVSRPDVIVGRYLADYIRVAGTYPCAQDPNRYVEDEDPVMKGQRCPITRPVATFAITATRVYGAGRTTMRFPIAEVRFGIAYADGHSWASSLFLGTRHYHDYFLSYTHQDCWRSIDILDFYPAIVSQAPPGAEYPTLAPDGHETGLQCHPAQTTS